jgi:hypothetical protein
MVARYAKNAGLMTKRIIIKKITIQKIRKLISKTIERFIYFAEDHKKG